MIIQNELYHQVVASRTVFRKELKRDYNILYIIICIMMHLTMIYLRSEVQIK